MHLEKSNGAVLLLLMHSISRLSVFFTSSQFVVYLSHTETVCGIRSEGPTAEALHSQKPGAVQVLVYNQLHRVRVHHVCADSSQHGDSCCAGKPLGLLLYINNQQLPLNTLYL